MHRAHDAPECRCPLASLHCPKQSTTREQWFEAIKQSREDVLEYYIKHATTGLNDAHEAYDFLTVQDEETRTPLYAATYWRRRVILLKLLDFLAKHGHGRKREILDMQDAKHGLTAMMWACKIGNLPMAKALREAGSSIKIRDFEDRDAKAWARASENNDLVAYLEENLEKETEPSELLSTSAAVNTQKQPDAEQQAALEDPIVDLWDTDEESDREGSGGESAQEETQAERAGSLENGQKPGKDELAARYECLSSNSILNAMDARSLARIARRCKVLSLERGESVFENPPESFSLWMVQTGEVTIPGGENDFDLVLEDHDVYGSMVVLVGDKHAKTLTATKDSVLLQVSQASIQEVLAKSEDGTISKLAQALVAEESVPAGEEELRRRKLERRIRTHLGIAKSAVATNNEGRQRHIEEVPLLTNRNDFSGISLAEKCWRSVDKREQDQLLNSTDADASGLPQYLRACESLRLQPHYRAVLQLRHDRLDMQGAGMTSRDALALGAALCCNKTVATLDVSHNALRDVGCVTGKTASHGIVDAVAVKTDLTALRLSCTQISRRVAEPLGKILLQHASLAVLDLSHNQLGDKGAASIAVGIRDSKARCLTDLDLSNNRIGNLGATAIGQMLETNLTLKVLSLSWNHIFPEGCAALITGTTAGNGNLHTLSLDWNRLGQQGGEALGRFLAESSSIAYLDVSNCGIHQTAAPALRDGIAANTTLKVAKMHWNPLGAGVPILLAAFQDCAAQPTFRLDNCNFDMLSHQAYTVDRNNPTGHYSFNLSVEQHRQQLKVLVELGMKERGENWRNERLDDTRFSFPSEAVWDIPDVGLLDFDFVHLDAVDDEEEEGLSSDDFKNLSKQINKALASSVRIDLIKQAASRFVAPFPHP